MLRYEAPYKSDAEFTPSHSPCPAASCPGCASAILDRNAGEVNTDVLHMLSAITLRRDAATRDLCNPDRSNIKSSRAARASGTQRSASALARKRESTGVIKRGDQRRLTIGVHPPRYGWISRNRNEVLLPNVDAVPAFGRPPTTFHAS